MNLTVEGTVGPVGTRWPPLASSTSAETLQYVWGPGVVNFYDEGPHLATLMEFPIANGWVADADIAVVDSHLVRHPVLAPATPAGGGLRTPAAINLTSAAVLETSRRGRSSVACSVSFWLGLDWRSSGKSSSRANT